MSSSKTKLRIGLDENSYTSWCLTSLNVFLNECPDIRVQSISFWLQMLWKHEMDLITYPVDPDGGWNDSVLEDLRNGVLDVSPVDYVIEQEHLTNYTVLSNFDFTPYYFYAKLPAKKENAFLFLFSPFNWHNWTLFVMTVASLTIFMFLLNARQHRCRISTKFVSKIRLVFVAFTLTLYTSNLKALLTVGSQEIPFRNLPELADKISEGNAKIYLESRSTWRWYLLMDEETQKGKEFQKLETALKSRPNGLRVVENLTVLCNAVSSDDNNFYFSYAKLIETECPNFCFWSYEIMELAPSGTSFLLPKNIAFAELANVFIHVLPMFEKNTLKMKQIVKQNCNARTNNEMSSTEHPNISLESLSGIVSILVMSSILSLVVFALELLWKKIISSFVFRFLTITVFDRNQRRTSVNFKIIDEDKF